MANEETQHQQSPWTRPGFLMAGALVMLLVIAGVVLSIIFTLGGNDDADSTSSKPATTAAPTPDEGEGSGSSVCGLDGDVLEQARLSKAPTVDEWGYIGTTSHPISKEYGPGETDESGFYYCFQRSPEGAVFAAANAVALGTDTVLAPQWMKYFLADGPFNEQLLSELDDSPSGATSASPPRMQIAGFRLLQYDGDSARVDMAVTTNANGQAVTVSTIYDLLWEDGDWKLSSAKEDPIEVVAIPNIAGYVAWGE